MFRLLAGAVGRAFKQNVGRAYCGARCDERLSEGRGEGAGGAIVPARPAPGKVSDSISFFHFLFDQSRARSSRTPRPIFRRRSVRSVTPSAYPT